MDNVVQNIKIEDIVPRNHRQTNENFKELEDLAISIRENGIKEPLVVKKKDNRYEIISGNKRYRAAILAGIPELPVIIKNYNDDNLMNNLKENDNISFNSINNNSDIVNLSELNKEYERDDFNMNNELPNNNVSQPLNNGGSTPTFGGRFFPSLEDQPTNMSFSAPIEPAVAEPTPVNNLIDLTDTSSIGSNNLNVAEPINQVPQSEVAMNPSIEQPVPGNIINLESLTQNNEVVQPQPLPAVNIDTNFQNTINDFNPNANEQIIEQPTISLEPQAVVMETPVASMPDLGIQQNVVPTIEEPSAIVQPEIIVQVEQPQSVVEVKQPTVSLEPQAVVMETPVVSMPDLGIQQNVVPTVEVPVTSVQPEVVVPVEQPQPVAEVVQPASIVQSEIVVPVQEIVQPVVEVPQQVAVEQLVQQKDVLPVINTLKAVGVSLESFGYTVRITDEDLPTSYKITIEVEK